MGDWESERSLARASGEQTATQALSRLESGHRHPQRDLQTLHGLWSELPSGRSCFQRSPRAFARPTRAAVLTVSSYLVRDNRAIAGAAHAAMRAAVWIARVHREEITNMPESVWEFAGLARIAKQQLTDGDPLQRLWFARLVAYSPVDQFQPVLRTCLHDTLYTVRWLAAGVLAALGDKIGLAEVLLRSPPHVLPRSDDEWMRDRSHDYWWAVDRLGYEGVELLIALDVSRPSWR